MAPHKNAKNVHQLGGFKPKNFTQFEPEYQNQGFNNFGYPSQNFGFSNNFPNEMQGNWGGFGGSSSGKGEKYPVSTSTRTSTETRNGQTVTKIVEKIQYSDGTVEEKEKILTN